MVSLFEILLQKPLWSHVTSGLSTLDAMLSLQSDAILDLQSVPTNSAFTVVLCHMICSHLSKSEEHKVVVLETINPFPWELLRSHSLFKKSWISEKRIIKYDLISFSKVYAFFKLMPLKEPTQGSIMVLITNFHELIELYRYQFSATHEEQMLQLQIERNRVLLNNHEKAAEEGLGSIQLPQLPQSSLLRENPYFRSQTHIHELFSLISSWSVKNCAVVLLLGHMEPRYVAAMTDTRMNSSSSSPANSQFEKRKLTFTPVTFGEAKGDKRSSSESKISCKLLFYSDWYFHSPHFKKEERPISVEDQYLVSVVKVVNTTGFKNITEPIYFDFKHAKSSHGPKITADCFINLSDNSSNQESDGLSSLLQETITSQAYAKPSTHSPASARRNDISTMPSSPPQRSSTSQIRSQHSPNMTIFHNGRESLAKVTRPTSSNLPSVIESSDVESTGTLLDDLADSSELSGSETSAPDNEASWLARHG